MSPFAGFFVSLLYYMLDYFRLALIVYIVLQMLTTFGILNSYQPFVRMVMDALERLFEPILDRIRHFLPSFGALDLSPILVFIITHALQYALSLMLH